MTRRLGRRDFLRATGGLFAVGGAAAVLSACTDPADVKRLSFLNWTDYIAPSTLPDFTRKSGIDVTYETYTSNNELQRRLGQAGRTRRGGRKATTFDLIVPSDNFVRQFRDDDLIQTLDRSKLTNLDNLAPAFRTEGFDPGNRYTVPWATGTTGIAYDTTTFGEPPEYGVFLDRSVKDKATILDETRDAYALALFSLGRNPNSRDARVVDAATDQLLDMKKIIRGFESGDYWKALASGELVVAQAYSSDFQLARERNHKLAFVLPDAGALRWVDSLAIPEGAPRKANAETFINYYLAPGPSAKVGEYVQIDNGNEAAYELLPQELKEDPVVFPPTEVLDRLQFTEYLGADEKLYNQGWARVRS